MLGEKTKTLLLFFFLRGNTFILDLVNISTVFMKIKRLPTWTEFVGVFI